MPSLTHSIKNETLQKQKESKPGLIRDTEYIELISTTTHNKRKVYVWNHNASEFLKVSAQLWVVPLQYFSFIH